MFDWTMFGAGEKVNLFLDESEIRPQFIKGTIHAVGMTGLVVNYAGGMGGQLFIPYSRIITASE